MNPQLNNPGNYSNKWQAADSNNLLTKPLIPINYLSMIFIGIIIKRSVPISKKSHCFSVAKTNRLKPFKNTMFFSTNHMKSVSTLQEDEFLIVTGSTHS